MDPKFGAGDDQDVLDTVNPAPNLKTLRWLHGLMARGGVRGQQ